MDDLNKAVSSLLPGLKIETVDGECETHGAFRTVRIIGSGLPVECPKCVDLRTRREDQQRAHQQRVDWLFKIAGIPERYRNCGLKNFQADTDAQKHARQGVNSYLRAYERHGWLPLSIHGPVGTGKTHLACALANNLIASGVSVRYTTMAAMLSDIKKAYSTEGMTEASQIERYVSDFELLILDEADVIRATDNDLGLIFAVLNGRYNSMRPVVTISNQPITALVEFLGARTVDRLSENAVSVVCDWDSYRRTS